MTEFFSVVGDSLSIFVFAAAAFLCDFNLLFRVAFASALGKNVVPP
jgi:hypothetical protein